MKTNTKIIGGTLGSLFLGAAFLANNVQKPDPVELGPNGCVTVYNAKLSGPPTTFDFMKKELRWERQNLTQIHLEKPTLTSFTPAGVSDFAVTVYEGAVAIYEHSMSIMNDPPPALSFRAYTSGTNLNTIARLALNEAHKIRDEAVAKGEPEPTWLEGTVRAIEPFIVINPEMQVASTRDDYAHLTP